MSNSKHKASPELLAAITHLAETLARDNVHKAMILVDGGCITIKAMVGVPEPETMEEHELKGAMLSALLSGDEAMARRCVQRLQQLRDRGNRDEASKN